MEQNCSKKPIPQSWDIPQPPKKVSVAFPTGAKELTLAVLNLITGLLLFNSMFFGGVNLGFAIFAALNLLFAVGYLLCSGCRFTGYSVALLLLSLGITAGFARSDDGFVKFVLFCFLLVSENLGLCLLAGQNRCLPGSAASLLDVPRTLFVLGIGKLPEAFRGLQGAFRRSGSAGKKGGAVLLGFAVAIPILAILIPLLVSADAAFDALLQRLPDLDFSELVITVLMGIFPTCVLYIRTVALRHAPNDPSAPKVRRKGISPLTVNTVLVSVVVVYGVYLASQLAYFSGGFLGILPDGYTAAQYARRGFFEMAWLCAINLSIMILAVGLVAKQKNAPVSTRLLCLFIGVVTLFLVAAASAKMFLYIGIYGLTRLRVLTEIIMLWLGLTTLVVSIWLFAPRLPYMKAILLMALVLGGSVLWADVDTVVARYNVTAYQSGRLESVDVSYLSSLGNGAVPYLQLLTEDPDPNVSKKAAEYLQYQYFSWDEDFRSWNYVNHIAEQYLPKPPTDTDTP